MTGNLKALGVALLAISMLGAIGAQGALGADTHQFKFDGQRTVLTGKNVEDYAFGIGPFPVKCNEVRFEGTVDAGVGQTEVDELTIRPVYSGCTYQAVPFTIFFNDCGYVFDSDTSTGNSTGGKHADLEIECAPGNQIEIHMFNCTFTIGPQKVSDAVRYTNDTASSFEFETTAHGIVIGMERTTESQPVKGCLTFPDVTVGSLVGKVTTECRRDEGSPQANPTTPGATLDSTATSCSVTDIEPEPNRSVLTGKQVGAHELVVGAVGTAKCTTATFGSTIEGNVEEEGVPTKLTVKPSYSSCEFNGQPATVKVNDCAYVLDSETTKENSTGGEHANLEIECAEGHKIEIHTVNCTVTVGPQLIKHALRYEEDTASSFTVKATAHGIVVGKARTTASQPVNGCLLFPVGAVGNLVGASTVDCLRDEGTPQANPTTPGATEEGEATECAHHEPNDSVLTGKQVGAHELVVGAVGTAKCTTATFGSTIEGNVEEEGVPTKLTVKPNYSECTFGGQPATVKVNDCAYVLDSETTKENSTGGEHANLEIECAEGHKIEIHTVNCTVTVGPQLIKHALRYEEDTASSFTVKATAHGIVVGKARTTASQPVNGCLLFPTGAVGKLVATSTVECLKDKGSPQANPTTPGATEEGEATEGCSPE